MTAFALTLFFIIAAVLTVWFVVVPAFVVAGTITGLRHGGHDRSLKGQEIHPKNT